MAAKDIKFKEEARQNLACPPYRTSQPNRMSTRVTIPAAEFALHLALHRR